MSEEQFSAKWQKLRGAAQEEWGELTESDLDRVVGKRDKLIGSVRERYNLSEEEAEQKVNEWSVRFGI